MSKKILIGINWLAAGILTLVLLFAAFIPEAFLNKENWVQPPVLIIVSIGLLIIINGIRKGVDLMTPKMYRWSLIIVGALIFIAQLFVALSFIDVARADSYFVREQAIALARGSQVWQDYFKIYPNNVNTALFEASLIKPFLKLGITQPWPWLNIIRFIWIDTGLLSGLFIIRRWKYWRPAALLLMITWLLSVPVYSFGLFSYNDPLIMPMALNIIALGLIFKSHHGKIRWLAGIGSWLLLALSVVMKSNQIVLWIAIFIILVIGSFAKMVDWKLALKWLVGSVITLVLFFGMFSGIAKNNGYVKSPDQSTPVTSWIAMSLNPQTQGQYNGADFYSVRSAKTATEKKTIANDKIRERVSEMGPIGLTSHFVQKLGVFLSHGDFDAINLNQQWVKAPSEFISHQDSDRFWALLVAQVGYITLLLGIIWKLFTTRKHLLVTSLLSMFTLGLTAFHVLIWEVEPRYALPLLPIIMVLGTVGWSSAPQFSFNTSRRVAVSGLMAVGIILSTFSLIQTTNLQASQTTSVDLQGIGSYFDPKSVQINPHEKYDFNVPVRGHSSDRIDLTSRSKSIVTITVSDNEKVIRKVTDEAKSTQTVKYPTTTARNLKISILNNSNQPVSYTGGLSSYSLTSGKILPSPQMNLKWYVDQTHRAPLGTIRRLTPREMDSSTLIILNATLFMTAILVVTWSRRKVIIRIFSRKRRFR
ncbi:hypothetical protein [Companilactobacillus sp.]|jgi:hypothetical protein|uniref:hypothetical protein n=1 Tax=Companilactobacillus sp. TaxID=2767905 RepID=UPI0025BC4AFE|nr:hypothetical protein [Companilactobacillus sp.]MCH4009414.1 hypothetical protein [Companilactobacillus sp.]MCH4050407.1 hypothetical protein [Companilactobacillus sp.]MCH4077356.1 hypothetical protein [Companilactobacillus sp.]MCH4125932.1 hypothetical protein [Companilactobacillus sp.]MCI1311641.1 hypothetical protein [Companilactobacillus sp.]